MIGTALTNCPACGHEDRGERDFCSACGAYLRWGEDPAEAGTAVLEPVTDELPATLQFPAPPPLPATAAPMPEPAAAIEAVKLTLAGGDAPGEAPWLEVEPGASVTLTATVRNQSGVVDGFALHLEGVPREWVAVSPHSVDLVPFGAEHGSPEAQVTLTITPPRTTAARAGRHHLEVVATSRRSGAAVAFAPAGLSLGAFERFESRIRPERVTGPRQASFSVPVRNLGNAPLALEFAGEDADGQARFSFTPPRLTIGPGEEAHTTATVQAPQPRSGADRRLTVFVSSAAQTLSGQALFVQPARRTHRTPVRIALGLLAVALLALAAFAPWTDGTAGIDLRYDEFAAAYLGYGDAPVPDAGDLQRVFDALTSAGMLALVLAFGTLVGLRRGGLAWVSGLIAIVGAVLLALAAPPGAAIALLFAGGICAVAAAVLVQR